MPKENIGRAIDRGTGVAAEAAAIERVVYEGYGPGGVAMLVETLTDNRNRTSQEVRHAFSKHGGSLGEPGSVAWQFEKRGVVTVDGDRYGEDDLMAAIDAGAEDVQRDGDLLRVICDASDLEAVRNALAREGIEVDLAEVAMEPQSVVAPSEAEAGQLLRLMDALDDMDDVGQVHANFDIPDGVMERLAA